MDPEETALSQTQAQLMPDIVHQIEKDLALGHFRFDLPHYPNLVALLPELTHFVAQVRDQNPALWMKLVYRVDLTEKQYLFVQKLGGHSPENMAKAIALRCFQKVHTRKQFGR